MTLRARRPARAAKGRRRPVPFRPTTRGWALAVLAPALYIAGRQVGSAELVGLTGAAIAVVVVSFGFIVAAPTSNRVDRVLPGGHVDAGDEVRVTYRLLVERPWLWPVQRLSETFARGGAPPELLTLSGVVAGRPTIVHFDRLPRGVYRLGPAVLTRTDPLGLFLRRTNIGSSQELRVWPRSVGVSAAMEAAGFDGMHNDLSLLGQSGDEFRALREFVSGDDIRRIHWPSSAKRDMILVRETEADAGVRATVVLDTRAGSYVEAPSELGRLAQVDTHPGFETAISTAASVLTSLTAQRWEVELVLIASGHPLVHVDGPKSLAFAMDLLAGAALTASDDPAALVVASFDTMRIRSGAMVMCGGTADAAIVGSLRRTGRRFRPLVAVLADLSRDTAAGHQAVATLASPGVTVVSPSVVDELPAAWYAAAIASRRGRASAAGVRR